MEFKVIEKNAWIPQQGLNTGYLQIDYWNDFSFITQFQLSIHDQNGNLHDIGSIKIGFLGQTQENSTFKQLPETFNELDERFFSLGQGVSFYKAMQNLPDGNAKQILSSLRDIVENPNLIDLIQDEKVFSISLLRDITLSQVYGQYIRVLEGGDELTNFNFSFSSPQSEDRGAINLDFKVEVESFPSTNIHAVIGRNGVGKTTLLNSMTDAITNREITQSQFFENSYFGRSPISESYFSSLVTVSFSAFDPFTPPIDQPDPAKGTCYFYIGLRNPIDSENNRKIEELQDECIEALVTCFRSRAKSNRWLKAIEHLGTDENFSSMNLYRLEEAFQQLHSHYKNQNEQSDSQDFHNQYKNLIRNYIERMSSGHAIVLLTMTKLVATVEEKTLILIDEPESHLHPPLLSAFIRALSDLLLAKNGVAIIATHSPVVLQEVPRSCVWKVYRQGLDIECERPKIETFAENVGTLTSEVFRLELEKSGFHNLLKQSVNFGYSYEEIIGKYDGQIGFEGRALLKAMIANRDKASKND